MLHRLSPLADRHAPHAFEYANETLRIDATGLAQGDLKKVALQLDDNSYWALTGIDPAAWVMIGGGTHGRWVKGKNIVYTGETVQVAQDEFMLGVGSFRLQGTINNKGQVVIL